MQIIKEINTILAQLEDVSGGYPKELMQQFAIRIDRIMGASKTISQIAPEMKSLAIIGEIAFSCKTSAYKASEKSNLQLVPIFMEFWCEAVETVEEIIQCLLEPEKLERVAQKNAPIVRSRMELLAKKVS